VFFENWSVQRMHQPWYLAVDALLPAMLLAKFMCWATIVTELGIIPCILIPGFFEWAIILNVLFQASLMLFTGTTFTVFFYSMTAASLAFVEWPTEPVAVTYKPNRASASAAQRFFSSWDLDKRLLWIPAESGLQFSIGSRVYSGFRALRMLLLLNPITYMVITAAIAGCESVPHAPLIRRLVVTFSLLLLMPPLAWVADKLFGGGDRQPVREFKSVGA
jgi:hypothetical protein